MSARSDRTTIFSVCIGGFLEFYEFTLFIYLAPIISQQYFHTASPRTALLYTLMIFAVGFLSRPLGGLLFGYVGDRYGRKIALISSIIMLTIPTIGIGLLPTNMHLAMLAPFMLVFLRLVQGVLTGGELSGIMCYLTEGIAPERRNFVSSWTFVSPQLGILASIVECIILDQKLTPAELADWGWRLSFLLSGAIGLIGCFLRYRLKETPLFAALEKHNKVLKTPIFETFRRYKKPLFKGFLLAAFPLTGDFLIFLFTAIYVQSELGFSFTTSMIINAILIIIATIALPLFGKLGNHFPLKPLMIASAIGVILLIYPLFIFSLLHIFILAIPLLVLVVLLFTCYSAYLPVVMADLFPTPVRYTSIGLSYTTASSIFGGTPPFLALYLIHLTGNAAMPSFILIISALFSLAALIPLKERRRLAS